MRRLAVRELLLLTALSAAAAAPAHAQRFYSAGEQRWLDSGWRQDLRFAAINAVLSGVVAGFFRETREPGTFGEGFRGGAVGGVVSYTGKRLAARRFDGAGLLGRQVTSVGGSIVSNSRDGRGAFDRLTLPLGLGRLYWDRTESRVTFRPDVITVSYTLVNIVKSDVGLDWSRSLSAGAPTFVSRRGAQPWDNGVAGRTFGGVIVADANAYLPLSDILVHEGIHVLQYDQHLALWGEPAERGLFGLFADPISEALGHVDVGLPLVLFAPLRGQLRRESNPFEVEADYLTAR